MSGYVYKCVHCGHVYGPLAVRCARCGAFETQRVPGVIANNEGRA